MRTIELKLNLSVSELAVLGEFLDIAYHNIKTIEFNQPLNEMQEALKLILPTIEAKILSELDDVPLPEFKDDIDQMSIEINQSRLN